ncbi:NAD-dependent epimerase/dehydratase family protein [Estrella lausannensis]|uniref:UDP-glucuronate 4-epimerase 4 n=1 Tax=Estrella lausannensis TaxID=483423 RepID=A0A0H5DQ42_9BACT|nr:NAD-dependent epimerase/dehydratase family protein [Estrella lausannensis]CRX38751.1 UDP-glucuronate 4-epimerase 4 [Estrella lausannensis]
MANRRVLITGMAGFIGYHLAKKLKELGDSLMGIDNFNDYYDSNLKRARIADLQDIRCVEGDIQDVTLLTALIKEFRPTHILHMAAQAGVRFSLLNPKAYIDANINGFLSILEVLKDHPEIKLLFASSSSVYGLNTKVPFDETDATDQQASFYGVTKKCNELMARTYHHLYGISAIGLRFFTVYGPFGRPDMAYYSFTDKIVKGIPIDVFGEDQMRDFTYIDDIIEGVIKAMDLPGGFEIFNLGNHRPVALMRFIQILESAVGQKAKIRVTSPQKGDVKETYASIEKSHQLLQFEPKTNLEEGIPLFVDWYRKYNAFKSL